MSSSDTQTPCIQLGGLIERLLEESESESPQENNKIVNDSNSSFFIIGNFYSNIKKIKKQ